MGARDASEAAKLLWKAVGKQNPTAAILLSGLYARGDGVTRNCDQARLLLLAATKHGSGRPPSNCDISNNTAVSRRTLDRTNHWSPTKKFKTRQTPLRSGVCFFSCQEFFLQMFSGSSAKI